MMYHTKKPKSLWLLFLIAVLSLLCLSYLSLRLGAITLSHHDLLNTLMQPNSPGHVQTIVIATRLPRLIAAILIGAALALSGLLMQGLTQNPIADPSLLGINAGASLFLALGYVIFDKLHYLSILILCLAGASLVALLILGISQNKTNYSSLRLILIGSMLSSFMTTLGQCLINLFHLSTTIIGWQSGSLVAVNWSMLAVIAPLLIGSIFIAQLFAKSLNLLDMGPILAQALGLSLKTTTRCLLLIIISSAAACVALGGNIPFIGLVIPHLIKRFVSKNYAILLPLSALLGANFLVLIDLLCRILRAPYELPLSVLTNLIGFPCLIWLMKKEISHAS